MRLSKIVMENGLKNGGIMKIDKDKLLIAHICNKAKNERNKTSAREVQKGRSKIRELIRMGVLKTI